MELVNHVEIPEIGLGVYKMEAGAEMNEALEMHINMATDYLTQLRCIRMRRHWEMR